MSHRSSRSFGAASRAAALIPWTDKSRGARQGPQVPLGSQHMSAVGNLVHRSVRTEGAQSAR